MQAEAPRWSGMETLSCLAVATLRTLDAEEPEGLMNPVMDLVRYRWILQVRGEQVSVAIKIPANVVGIGR